MQFLIKACDGPGMLEKRIEVRPRHLEGMKKLSSHIICAGGLLDDEGKMKGSALVMEFPDRAALDEYISSEPYVVEGVWKDIEVETMNVVILKGTTKTICLAGGCFWGMQQFFDQFDGVLKTQVGYANGPDRAPTYQEVCSDSGHAETVRIDYDESRISLEELLDYYFMVIDPLSVNRQGNDKGVQYRTGIYYTDEKQLPRIKAVYHAEEEKAGAPLAVELEPLENFFPAEEYHQKYLDKNPGGYCHIPRSYMHLKKDR